jgi:hypothetical protein
VPDRLLPDLSPQGDRLLPYSGRGAAALDDAVDEVIKRVIADGGDVSFYDPGRQSQASGPTLSPPRPRRSGLTAGLTGRAGLPRRRRPRGGGLNRGTPGWTRTTGLRVSGVRRSRPLSYGRECAGAPGRTRTPDMRGRSSPLSSSWPLAGSLP